MAEFSVVTLMLGLLLEIVLNAMITPAVFVRGAVAMTEEADHPACFEAYLGSCMSAFLIKHDINFGVESYSFDKSLGVPLWLSDKTDTSASQPLLGGNYDRNH